MFSGKSIRDVSALGDHFAARCGTSPGEAIRPDFELGMEAGSFAGSGVSLERGIGCFDDARVLHFYDAMVGAGVVPAGFDIASLYTNRFVCRGVGMELRPAAAP